MSRYYALSAERLHADPGKRSTDLTYAELEALGVPILFSASDVCRATGASKSVVHHHANTGTLRADAITAGGFKMYKPETVKEWARKYRRPFAP